jgi:hypothetical protein
VLQVAPDLELDSHFSVTDFDSDGAISAPEMMLSPTMAQARYAAHGIYFRMTSQSFAANRNEYRVVCNGSAGQGKTIDDIFSSQEYRNWADQPRPCRWSHTYGEQQQGQHVRSTSLPPRALLNEVGWSSDAFLIKLQVMSPRCSPRGNLLDRLHISPLMNRRVPLRAAGPGFDVDRLSTHSLNGILIVQVHK